MPKARGGQRRVPTGEKAFIAYLACACCGKWWPLARRQLKCLLDPAWFICPFCHQGRKRACNDWDYKTRRPPTPAMLDIRVREESEGATIRDATITARKVETKSDRCVCSNWAMENPTEEQLRAPHHPGCDGAGSPKWISDLSHVM